MIPRPSSPFNTLPEQSSLSRVTGRDCFVCQDEGLILLLLIQPTLELELEVEMMRERGYTINNMFDTSSETNELLLHCSSWDDVVKH